MAEVGEARGCDVDSGADGDEDENEGVDGWGGVLVANGDDIFLGVSRGGQSGFLLVEGEGRVLFEI